MVFLTVIETITTNPPGLGGFKKQSKNNMQ